MTESSGDLYSLKLLTGLAKGTFNLAVNTTSLVLQFSKAAYGKVSDRCHLDERKMLYISTFMKRQGRFVKDELLLDLKLYLKSQNLEEILHEIHEQTIRECARYKVVNSAILPSVCKRKTNENSHWIYDCNSFGFPQEKTIDVLRPLIWALLNNRVSNEELISEDVHLMRQWNQRVNERELIQKLGVPNSWNIFDVTESSLKTSTKQWNKPHIKSYNRMNELGPENDLVKKEINGNTNRFNFDCTRANTRVFQFGQDNRERVAFKSPDDDVKKQIDNEIGAKQVKQKKHGLFHPIKKLFKGNKMDKQKQVTRNEQNLPKIQNNLQSTNALSSSYAVPDMSKRQDCVGIRKRSRKSYCPGGDQIGDFNTYVGQNVRGQGQFGQHASDPHRHVSDPHRHVSGSSDEGLVMHIPSNVQKVILVKDGRKITIEV